MHLGAEPCPDRPKREKPFSWRLICDIFPQQIAILMTQLTEANRVVWGKLTAGDRLCERQSPVLALWLLQ